MWREQAIIEWSWHVNSVVDCCHSVKLCAYAARDFRSQQNGAVTRMWRSCGVQPSHKERAIGVVRCKKAGMLLQPLRWCCVDCVIHHERDVREEQHYSYMWRAQDIIEWSCHVHSIVDCCHSAKFCAYAARDFRSQHWTSAPLRPHPPIECKRTAPKSRHAFVHVKQHLITLSDNNNLRAAQWADYQWNAEWTDSPTRLRMFITDTGTPPEWPSQEEPRSGLTASAPVSEVSAPACTNGAWSPLRSVSVAQKNKPSTMLSSNVQSIDLPTDCTAWRFWAMRQFNGCSTPAPRSRAAKQWFQQLAQKKKQTALHANCAGNVMRSMVQKPIWNITIRNCFLL